MLTVYSQENSADSLIRLLSKEKINWRKISRISGNNLIKNGEDKIYWGISGTVTRTSATKISFTGVCKEDASATITHTFEGYIESDVYKVE